MKAFFAIIAASLSVVAAAPNMNIERDVFDPTVTYPHAGTVWHTGSRHNVTWDTSNAPVNISNGAAIFLRADFDAPFQFTPIQLAKGFNLRSGRQEITVPNGLKCRDDYVINLFGDSGNIGPRFTIIRYNS